MHTRGFLRRSIGNFTLGKTLKIVALLIASFVVLFGIVSCTKPVPVPSTTHSVTGVVQAPADLPYTPDEAVASTPEGTVTVEKDGSFTAKVSNDSMALVSVVYPNSLVLMNLVSGSSTMTTQALSKPSTVVPMVSTHNAQVICNIETTAWSLVFLNLAVFTPDPSKAQQVMRVIRTDSEVAAFAAKLQELAATPDPMSNTALLDVYRKALTSVVRQLPNPTGVSNALGSLPSQANSHGAIVAKSTGLQYPEYLRSIDLNWIQLSDSDIKVQGDKYIITPSLWKKNAVFREATTWLLEVNELAPQSFADTPYYNNRTVFDWKIDGYSDSAVLQGTSIFEKLDFIGVLVDAVFGLVPGVKVKSTLSIPADRPGVYVVRGSSGGLLDGDQFGDGEHELVNKLHYPGEPDGEFCVGEMQHRSALSANIVRIASRWLSVIVSKDVIKAKATFLATKSGEIILKNFADISETTPVGRLIGLVRDTVKTIILAAIPELCKGSVKQAINAAMVYFNVGIAGGVTGDIISALVSDSPIERAVIVVGENCVLDGIVPKLDLQYQGPYPDGNVGFYWTATDNCKASTLEYRYMLEGHDSDWTTWSATVTTASYNSLPAGNYTFKVEAKDDAGNIGNASQVITVSNPTANLIGTWKGTSSADIELQVSYDGQTETQPVNGPMPLGLSINSVSSGNVIGSLTIYNPEELSTPLGEGPITQGTYTNGVLHIRVVDSVNETINQGGERLKINGDASITLAISPNSAGSSLEGSGEITLNVTVVDLSTNEQMVAKMSGTLSNIDLARQTSGTQSVPQSLQGTCGIGEYIIPLILPSLRGQLSPGDE